MNQILDQYKHTDYLLFIPKSEHHCTLKNFDFSKQNVNLPKTLHDFIEGKGKKKGLYLHGKVGIGKTHLLVSLYRVLLSKTRELGACSYYIFDKFVEEVENEKENPYDLEIACNVDWLFMDDITTVKLEGKRLEFLRKIVTERYEKQLPIAITSNYSIEGLEVQGLHPHAISRLNSLCIQVELRGRDRR